MDREWIWMRIREALLLMRLDWFYQALVRPGVRFWDGQTPEDQLHLALNTIQPHELYNIASWLRQMRFMVSWLLSAVEQKIAQVEGEHAKFERQHDWEIRTKRVKSADDEYKEG